MNGERMRLPKKKFHIREHVTAGHNLIIKIIALGLEATSEMMSTRSP
jgi:hypothetical protein